MFTYLQSTLVMNPFSERIKTFIDNTSWTFAKTMPEWPHEYIVREKVDESLFVEMVIHIREIGFQSFFYQTLLTYFEEDGLLYWTMGEPLNKTTIINRCKVENSYESRLKKGTLPDKNK
jgi:hypothetical protein